uniref:Uncharacterized protein n=1 Tax=Arundo donax TaxID=35708 RepID=A0A0A9EWH8_ARUDO
MAISQARQGEPFPRQDQARLRIGAMLTKGHGLVFFSTSSSSGFCSPCSCPAMLVKCSGSGLLPGLMPRAASSQEHRIAQDIA